MVELGLFIIVVSGILGMFFVDKCQNANTMDIVGCLSLAGILFGFFVAMRG